MSACGEISDRYIYVVFDLTIDCFLNSNNTSLLCLWLINLGVAAEAGNTV